MAAFGQVRLNPETSVELAATTNWNGGTLKWRRASRPLCGDEGKPISSLSKKLPHIRMEGAAYFVIWRLRKDQPELSATERSLIAAALRHLMGIATGLKAMW